MTTKDNFRSGCYTVKHVHADQTCSTLSMMKSFFGQLHIKKIISLLFCKLGLLSY